MESFLKTYGLQESEEKSAANQSVVTQDSSNEETFPASDELCALGIYTRLDQVFDAPQTNKELLNGQFSPDQSYIGSKETGRKGDEVLRLGMVVAGHKERPKLDRAIQDDKKGMAVVGEVIEALLEMNSVTVVKKQEEELINQDMPIQRLQGEK